MGTGDSTNDIAHLLGMLDPWYERNTLTLLNLPANVVCQVQLEPVAQPMYFSETCYQDIPAH